MNYLINKMLQSFEEGLKNEVQYFIIGKPYSLSKEELLGGVLMIDPVSTNINPVTTGIQDQEEQTVNIILAKSVLDKFNNNAERQSAVDYLIKIFEQREADGSLKQNTIRWIVRNNLRTWGLLQNNLSINYSTSEDIEMAEGAVTASMSITQTNIINQTIR